MAKVSKKPNTHQQARASAWERIREETLGSATLRLLKEKGLYRGVVIRDNRATPPFEGSDPDLVWGRMCDEALKANPLYVGYSGARNRFLHWFNGGFHSPAYEASERKYKLEAKAALEEGAPLEEAVSGSGLGEAVWAAFQTNLLSPFEKMRVRDALRSPQADAFIRAAAEFALEPSKPSLLALERVLKEHNCAKWTVITYLPFLWRPEHHMFLKPEVTKDFAARVGHRFAADYAPALDFAIYESLLDLAARTERELSDLTPRDRIDIQSFIWVVSDYKDGQQQPQL